VLASREHGFEVPSLAGRDITFVGIENRVARVEVPVRGSGDFEHDRYLADFSLTIVAETADDVTPAVLVPRGVAQHGEASRWSGRCDLRDHSLKLAPQKVAHSEKEQHAGDHVGQLHTTYWSMMADWLRFGEIPGVSIRLLPLDGDRQGTMGALGDVAQM